MESILHWPSLLKVDCVLQTKKKSEVVKQMSTASTINSWEVLLLNDTNRIKTTITHTMLLDVVDKSAPNKK